jgi:uncharacterized membrane protein
MTLLHLHLLLNHVPTIGTALAIALFILSFFRKNDMLRRVSLEVFFVVALVTIPAYLSGLSAQQQIQDREGVSNVMIEAHEDAALFALVLMQITGGMAWLALWQFRRKGRSANWATGTIMLLSALTMAVTARAANLGGEIRHPELLAVGDETAAPAADPAVAEPGAEPGAAEPATEAAAEGDAQLGTDPAWISANALGLMMTDRTWLWPASESLHFIGMWLLFGIVLIAHLRMVGLFRMWSFSAVHRLLPWAALGFAVNTITGMGFVTAAPHMYVENVSFLWKIGFLMLAGVNLLYATVFEGPWHHAEAGEDPPLRVKVMGASAIISWLGVMYFGRMLPFIGEAF